MSRAQIPPLPMSEQERRARRRMWLIVLLVVLALAGLVAFLVWFKLFREVRTPIADDAESFKYGAIGNEAYDGIPYWIWLVLPRVFPEYLPGNGGYAALGMVTEPGDPDGKSPAGQVPIGFSLTTVGMPRVAMNCAICHLSVVRKPGEVVPRTYPGGTGNQMDTQGYLKFLFACANDPRFTPDVLLEQIDYNVKLSALDRLLYRTVLIPQTKRALLQLAEQYAFMSDRTPWSIG
ncbi:MAG TPA: hypothetical protein VKP69_01735, partial [Isosphaeraceae bacterium]|nr:hypothetical protein [Isosphaeraceae bacterium]